MKKPVFATNFDTVHRIACFKRDIQGDMSNFDKQRESVLHETSSKACRDQNREEAINGDERTFDGLWAVDTVLLFDDGTARCTVRTHAGGKDETKTRFVYIPCTVCERSEVPALIEHEKSVLSYWFIPDAK